MDNSRKIHQAEQLQPAENKRLCLEDEFLDIQRFPLEIRCHILSFLDLEPWKNARRVSQEWKEILSHPKITSKFVLKISDCHITKNKAPMATFQKSTIFSKNVEIAEKVTWNSQDELLEFLRMIGKEAVSLTISDPKYLNIPFWTNFPMLKTFKSPILEFNDKIPSNVKSFNICKTKHLMNASELQTIERILADKTKEIVIECVELTIFPEKSQKIFINIEPALYKMAQQLGMVEIKISPMKLHETPTIKFADVEYFHNPLITSKSLRTYITSINKDVFLAHLLEMPKLQRIEMLYHDNCFSNHSTTIKHLGLKELIVNGELCENCLVFAFKTFPNLKKIECSHSKIGLDLILKQPQLLEKIYFDGKLNLAPTYYLPPETLNKLSNLTELCFRTLESFHVEDEIELERVFRKWPKMPKLVKLEIECQKYEEFDDLYIFFCLCPNIKKFSFIKFKNIKNVVKLLKLWPQLQELKLHSFQEPFSKTFVDAIAPYAKNLINLHLYDFGECVEFFVKGSDAKTRFEKLENYIRIKIPSLRKTDFVY